MVLSTLTFQSANIDIEKMSEYVPLMIQLMRRHDNNFGHLLTVFSGVPFLGGVGVPHPFAMATLRPSFPKPWDWPLSPEDQRPLLAVVKGHSHTTTDILMGNCLKIVHNHSLHTEISKGNL